MLDLRGIYVNIIMGFGYYLYQIMKIMIITEEDGSQEERLEARKLKPGATSRDGRRHSSNGRC